MRVGKDENVIEAPPDVSEDAIVRLTIRRVAQIRYVAEKCNIPMNVAAWHMGYVKYSEIFTPDQ